MEVVIRPTADEVARRAAQAVLERLPVGPDREPVLGLATGSSPLGLYRELGRAVARGEADFARAHGVALDEYVGLPPGHPEGYREVLLRDVCGVIGLAPDRLAVPDGSGRDVPSLMAAAAAYEARIAELGGVDVQVLGIGANGHLGFNEPGSALTSRTRVKRLSDRTRRDNARFFRGLDDVPTHCVTQGLGTILEARRLVLVATGDAKADAVAAALEGPLTASVPASVLQWHPDTVVCLDEAAAAALRNRPYYDDAASGLPG
jgi:glucosamine-6-phosphate deaminase